MIRTLAKAALVLAAALVLLAASIGTRILHYPTTPSAGTYDCAIVLGAGVDKQVPSPVFQARLDHGIDLYHRGIVRHLIFTGGLGKGDALSESAAGRAYALQRGIPASDTSTESISRTTRQNLEEAKKLMAKHQQSHAIIVSDPLHLRRSQIIANWLGMNATVSATPTSLYRSWRTRFPFLLREIYFTIHFRLFRQ